MVLKLLSQDDFADIYEVLLHFVLNFLFINLAYNSGEKDVVRPLKFVPLSKASCRLNPKALNKYWEELFYINGTFKEEESLAILQDERNYHFWSNTVTSLGKICDVVVDPGAFRDALISAGSD